MGKTAIIERLFNITFFKNNGVIPFYYEVKEIKMWEAVDFERKLEAVKKRERIDRAIGFIFPRCGFTKEAEDYCKEKGIPYSGTPTVPALRTLPA